MTGTVPEEGPMMLRVVRGSIKWWRDYDPTPARRFRYRAIEYRGARYGWGPDPDDGPQRVRWYSVLALGTVTGHYPGWALGAQPFQTEAEAKADAWDQLLLGVDGSRP